VPPEIEGWRTSPTRKRAYNPACFSSLALDHQNMAIHILQGKRRKPQRVVQDSDELAKVMNLFLEKRIHVISKYLDEKAISARSTELQKTRGGDG